MFEVGFGDGRFLDWCKNRGLKPAGVEILDAALEKARSLGHEVFGGPFDGSTLEPDRLFDVIAAFDVMEHLTISEMRKLFKDSLPHLALEGRYLFRFPNGNSPFVGPTQTGDITHRTLVSPGLIDDLVKPLGLRVVSTFNDRFFPPGVLSRLKRAPAYALRGVIESAIGLAYFGRILPLDPNAFAVVARMT